LFFLFLDKLIFSKALLMQMKSLENVELLYLSLVNYISQKKKNNKHIHSFLFSFSYLKKKTKIDAQDDYTEALQKLHQTVTKAHQVNPAITFEVFIHKSDGLSDEQKIGKK